MNVSINNTAAGDAYIVHVDGELDVYTAPRLKEALDEGVGRGHKVLVVDLTRVGFLDSTALGVLVGALRSIRSENRDMRLVLDHPHVAKMFRITGFDGMFPIFGTVAEALAAARSGS
jgi:anti-sigma B factor antagonist